MVLFIPHVCIVTSVGLHLSRVTRIGPIKRNEPLPAITPQSRDTRIQVTLGHGQPIATFYKSVHLKVWWGGSTLHPKSWPN